MSPNHPPTQLRRRVLLASWRLHRWLGLAFGVVLIVISVTGSLLVIHDTLEARLEHGVQVVAPADATTPLTPVVRRLAQEHQNVRPTFLRFHEHAPERAWKLYFRNDEDRTQRFIATINPYSGETLSFRHQDQGTLTGVLLQLHFTLLLGRWGTLITAVASLVLVITSVSGFYIYRHALRDMWRLPFRRIQGSRHVARDLHRWAGTWALLFNLLIGITGAWFMALVIPNRFASPKPSASAPYSTANLPDLDSVVAKARAHYPAAELLNLSIPQRSNGKITVSFLHRDAAPWHKFSRVSFDATTGAQIAVADAQTLPFWAKVRSSLSPLHFGFYGSAWVQALYFVGGLMPGLLSLSGFFIWRTRHARALAAAAGQTASGSPATAQSRRLSRRTTASAR